MWLSLSLSLSLSVMWTGKFVSVFVMLSTNDQQKLIDTIASLSSLFSLFSLAPCSWNFEDLGLSPCFLQRVMMMMMMMPATMTMGAMELIN